MLRDYSIALARRDKEVVLSVVADDVEWDIVGARKVRGKTAKIKRSTSYWIEA